MPDQPEDITQLLSRAAEGDTDAASALLPLVYEELRALAGSYLASERPDHTLQPTAIVHEAYLRLVGTPEASWNDRTHFFRAAALAMRRVLVNHARDRNRLKRGGARRRVPLADDTPAPVVIDETLDLLALDEALAELGRADKRKEQIVELRFFGGFSIDEISEILRISPAQVKRDWTTARAFLASRLAEAGDAT